MAPSFFYAGFILKDFGLHSSALNKYISALAFAAGFMLAVILTGINGTLT